MNMQKTYIQLPGLQMYDFHTQISGLVVQSYQPYYTLLPEVVFRCEYFLISSSNISKTYFFRTLAHDVFFRFNREEESIAIPEIHLKLVFLYVKLEIKDIQTLRKKKVQQAVSGTFAQKWLLCKTWFLSYLRPKFLKNTIEVVHI